MPRVGTGKLLDPMKAIDVVKYAFLWEPIEPWGYPLLVCCSVEGQATHVPEQARCNYINRNHEEAYRRQQDQD